MQQAILYQKLGNNTVQCNLCAHRCVIAEEDFGFCGVRQNCDGVLYTHTYGAVIAANPDPIEKKPLYHFLPGHRSFSIATRGCNFRCGFCQNWGISQVLSGHRSPATNPALQKTGGQAGRHVTGHKKNQNQKTSPEDIVQAAIETGCKSIAYTYTEPTIFFEYALDCARLAHEKSIKNIFVTNGFMTSEALDVIVPYLDAANVDLKSFSDDFYQKQCKGRLQPVLDTIRQMKKRGVWVEITTLVIPGYNDSTEELYRIAAFIASVDKNIPWHISRFHGDYQFATTPETPVEILHTAYKIGEDAGLYYIYLGNVTEGSDTICPACKNIIITRRGFHAIDRAGLDHSQCTLCGTVIAGVF